MATRTVSTRGNIFDVNKMRAPNGSPIDNVVNTLVETDDFTNDTPAIGANGGLTHHGLRTVSLPTGYLVDIGGSWKTSKSQREPFVEGLCTIKSTYEAPKDTFTTVDPALGKALLKAEKDAFIEMMNQTAMKLILKGSTVPNQSSLIGLMQRPPYNAIDNKFTFSVGGTGSNLRSCWLIKPGIETVCSLYNPYHPTLGIEESDKGEQLIDNLGDASDEHRWDIMVEYMIQKGICIQDQTAIKRICNVPCAVSDPVDADLINSITDASIINATKKRGLGQWMLYCDERLYSKLVRGVNDKLMVFQNDQNIYHTKLWMIGSDIIIRRMDALNCELGSGETEVTT